MLLFARGFGMTDDAATIVIPRSSFRARLYLDLETFDDDGALSWANYTIIWLTLLSFALLAVETELAAQARMAGENLLAPGFQRWPAWLGWLAQVGNPVVLGVFALEYGARLWSCGADPRYRGFKGRIKYASKLSSVTDFLAFGPELIVMFLPHEPGAGLAALRMFRLLRLFKLARYMPAVDLIARAFQRAKPQLLVTLMFAGVLLFFSASMLYLIEGVGGDRLKEFGSIPRALWWAAVTLTTIGYGDVFPVTPIGKIAAAITALAGIAVVALPTGIFASAFTEELAALHARKKKGGE